MASTLPSNLRPDSAVTQLNFLLTPLPLRRAAQRFDGARVARHGRVKAIPRIALKTVAIVGVIIAIALLIAQDQETLRVRSAFGAEDPRFPDYIAAIMGSPLTSVDHYDMLVNGDRLFPAMLQAIEQAKRRISFETYTYADGEIGDRFTAAFVAAAKRGVLTTIVLDAVGQRGSRQAPRRRAGSGRLPGRLVQPADLALARGSELSHPSQDSRGRWRGWVHRRRRDCRPLEG